MCALLVEWHSLTRGKKIKEEMEEEVVERNSFFFFGAVFCYSRARKKTGILSSLKSSFSPYTASRFI